MNNSLKLSKPEIEEIKNILFEKRIGNRNFNQLIEMFEKNLCKIKLPENRIFVEDFFGTKKGFAKAKELLLKDGKILNFSGNDSKFLAENSKADFSGLYVFYCDDKPFYVGISRGVIKRIQQHIKGKSHFTATMAFKIASLWKKRVKGREEFNKSFEENVKPVQSFLRNCELVLFQVKGADELALFEIFISVELGTFLNSFETH